ncbi:hypothetical protein [Telmatospirillum sp. J64-1]|uniref:hypothetical protein n=1 Tax=Telmatospirillum sp. J64-1 TaxID=2502183 RepID=UPI00115C5B18|nr:hypothetical protein [Telmatospirillum sp. J64-1]
MSLRPIVTALLLVVTLSGCGLMSAEREMPKNSGAGTDEMKLSPCACQPLDYDGRGYQWVS